MPWIPFGCGPCIDPSDECLYFLLRTVPTPACQNPGVDKFTGILWDPHLEGTLPLGRLKDGPLDIRKKAVKSYLGIWLIQRKAIPLPNVA